jgi:tetratricopeptide (TPR) repeat protein
MRSRALCRALLLAMSLLPSAGPAAGQAPPLASDSHLFDRLGARFSLTAWGGSDSNVLRLSNGQSDSYGGAFPSLALEFPFSPTTALAARYRLGYSRYASTALLNTTSHRGELRLAHRVGDSWKLEVYDAFDSSNQPDVLTSRSSLAFVSYTQNSEGFSLFHNLGARSGLRFEYEAHQRWYSSRMVGPRERQRDFLHSITLSGVHRLGERTSLALRAGWDLNLSNAPSYRYSEPFVSAHLLHQLGSDWRLEAFEQVAALRFSRRPLSDDRLRNRSDAITTTMVGLRRQLLDGIAVTARYVFEKDFSNEPLRRFADHRLLLGFEVELSREPRLIRSAAGVSLASARAAELANRGYQALVKQDYEEALWYSLKALAIDPRLAQAHTNAGIAYYKKGMVDEAVSQWRVSLALEPSNDAVRKLLEKAAQPHP